MAKKSSESGEFSFLELDNYLTKNVDDRGSIVTDNAYSKIDEYIPSGNYMLNAQLSGSLFGGYPNCRATAISGESATGKSFLLLNACREAQKMGYNIIYCDSEAAQDLSTFENFGVDPTKVRLQPVTTPLEFKSFVANLIKKLKEAKADGKKTPKIMLVLDSLGNLATTKEKDDAVTANDKRDMTKASEMRSLFRVIISDLAEMKINFLFSNHSYASIGSFFPTQTMAGGGGPMYCASTILMLSKAGLKDDNKEDMKKAEKVGMTKTGIIVTSKPLKSRFAKPIPIKFHISFYRGMNPYVGLEEYVNWENCGIGVGKLQGKKEFDELAPAEQKKAEENGQTWTDAEGNFYFANLKDTLRNKEVIVKSQNKTYPLSAMFTKQVITDEVLHDIDERIIKPMFALTGGKYEEDNFDELIDSKSDDE